MNDKKYCKCLPMCAGWKSGEVDDGFKKMNTPSLPQASKNPIETNIELIRK